MLFTYRVPYTGIQNVLCSLINSQWVCRCGAMYLWSGTGSAYSASSSNFRLQGEEAGTHCLFSWGLVSKMSALVPENMRNKPQSVSVFLFLHKSNGIWGGLQSYRVSGLTSNNFVGSCEVKRGQRKFLFFNKSCCPPSWPYWEDNSNTMGLFPSHMQQHKSITLPEWGLICMGSQITVIIYFCSYAI